MIGAFRAVMGIEVAVAKQSVELANLKLVFEYLALDCGVNPK
jgi:hypothetical protein